MFDRLGRLDFLSRGKGEANGLLLAILGVYGDIFPAPQVPARKEDDRLSTALLLIQGNYHKADFNVERLCTAMHVNRVTLYRLFSGKLGVSPNGYISHYRLEQGKKASGDGLLREKHGAFLRLFRSLLFFQGL